MAHAPADYYHVSTFYSSLSTETVLGCVTFKNSLRSKAFPECINEQCSIFMVICDKDQCIKLINVINIKLPTLVQATMRIKAKLIIQIVCIIISFILVIALIAYVAKHINTRPRTPDGTIPTKGEIKVYTIKGNKHHEAMKFSSIPDF